jgi:hypothetical protein
MNARKPTSVSSASWQTTLVLKALLLMAIPSRPSGLVAERALPC